MSMGDRPRTIGQLRESGYRPISVKDEMRRNLIDLLRRGDALFDGIIGYDETVFPQIVNAILSKHDMLFLGLRGQAKTRMLRALPKLLDEFSPVVTGGEIHDDPISPRFKATKDIISRQGDETPIEWVHRDQRYQEKLATPDVTIADLLGEVDLVKHAEGRYLADESIMHFGLIPRTNRGIFAINELPDLAPRIQVGLFNVLEERDVQIRGFPVRLPLDVMLVFSANPEDYTNRGRIVTPLKDRIGSVIRTHYPRAIEEAKSITLENAWIDRNDAEYEIKTPSFMHDVIEEIARLARTSPHINQESGVSVRTSIANFENMISNAERRGILLGEKIVVPRISDLANIIASCRGKIELMLAENDGSEDKLIASLIGEAVKNVAAEYFELSEIEPIAEYFHDGDAIQMGDETSSEEYPKLFKKLKGLGKSAEKLLKQTDSGKEPPFLASAAEFVLEALYVNNLLSKYAFRKRTFYKR
jgi:magnesium chelatase subunit I